MKTLLPFLLVLIFSVQTNGQSNIDEFIQVKKKNVNSTFETSLTVQTCDQHGNTKQDTVNVKLSFDGNKQLIIAERVFDKTERYAYYFFKNNILSLIIFNTEAGDIVEKPFTQQISFSCLYNFDGAFVKAVLDKSSSLVK